MRKAGFCGAHRCKKVRTTWRNDAHDKAVALVQREFNATVLDRLWLADITCIPTWARFLYLAVVIDACSRKVVGWAMADHLRTDLVIEALNMAAWNRRPAAGVIHHSDQGSLRHPRVRAHRPHDIPDRSEAPLAVFDYIEGFYNTRRRHSALGYASPNTYEARLRTTDQAAA